MALEVYTLDRVVQDFKISADHISGILTLIQDGYGIGGYILSVKYWLSGKMGGYRYNFTVSFENGESCFIGVDPNGRTRSTKYKWVRMEYNPAKVISSVCFRILHGMIADRSTCQIIKRIDIAIDIPVERSDFIMDKDERTLFVYMNSESDKTEYLGQRSAHGRAKLYNKQIESKLPTPLTRLELTMDYERCTNEEFARILPKVSWIETGQMTIDDLSLSDTDKVLTFACMDNKKYLKMLGRRKKEKIESIIAKYFRSLQPDYEKYNDILSEAKSYCKSKYEGDFKEVLEIRALGWCTT